MSRTLLHRAETVVSDLKDKDSEKEHIIKGALNMNIYPDWVVEGVESKKPATQPTLDQETDQSNTPA